MLTGLEVYSLAIVAEDIEEDSQYIKAFPIEIISDYTGNINEKKDINTVAVSPDGTTGNIVVNKSNLLVAKWSNIAQPNRLTPPTVMKGETVVIFTYGADRYYWISLYNELDLRTREKVIYAYSNKADIKDATKISDLYFYTVDTINKLVQLHTDDNDGEYTTYDIKIETREGILTIKDGKDNSFIIDSKNDTININTNAIVNITTKDTNIYTDTFKVKNKSNELIDVLIQLVDNMIAEQHIGNLGVPTTLTGGSITAYQDIKSKLKTFVK